MAMQGPYGYGFAGDAEFLGEPYPAELATRGVAMSWSMDAAGQKTEQHAEEQQFIQGDEAPSLPQHPFFKLVATCLYVRTASPYILGNCLLSFLRMRLATPALKLRRAKFTAKADLRHSDGNCTVKLRVYCVSDDMFVVELQRRAGDAVACAGIFRELTEHLDEQQFICGFIVETDD